MTTLFPTDGGVNGKSTGLLWGGGYASKLKQAGNLQISSSVMENT